MDRRAAGEPALRKGYDAATLAIFAIEVVIALFVRDRFVRPYLGDVLAVVLVYTALRAVTLLRVLPAVAIALAIAFAVEFGQWLGLLDLLRLGGNPVAKVVLGSYFGLEDLVAYTAGAAFVVALERWRVRRATYN